MTNESTSPLTEIVADPVWKRVRVGEGCWPYMGARTPDGYGRMSRRGKYVYAHRVVAEITFGSIPEGLWVLHRCDNPPCVRPDHLFLGTPTDNAKDRDQKGRNRWVLHPSVSGPPRPRTLFLRWVRAQAEALRRRHRDGESYSEIAKTIGISKTETARIITGHRQERRP